MKAYFAGEIIKEDRVIKDAYLLVEAGKIKGIEKSIPEGTKTVFFPDSKITPGFIDVHTHGALGYEPGFGSVKELRKWCRFKTEHGVTGFLPSTASISLECLKKAAANVKKARNSSTTNVLGMQMEGPFFSKGKKIGAQNPEYVINGFPEDYREFIKKNSEVIRYLAIDPQVNNAGEIVQFCKELGIKVSAAHSEILYQDFIEKKNGYSAITHTFNGMVGIHHRKPGLAYAACMDSDLFSEIICDGFHVIFPVLRLFFKLKDFDRIMLITDSMLATGMPPGSSYSIGDIEVTVSEEGKVCMENGSLAGSTLTLDRAVRNLVNELDIPLVQVMKMAALNPARMLGIDDKKGSLEPGKDADFIVLDQKLEVKKTFVGGEVFC